MTRLSTGESRVAKVPHGTLAESLVTLDRKPRLDDAERLTRAVLMDVICERCTAADEAAERWAEATEPRGLVEVIVAEVEAAGQLPAFRLTVNLYQATTRGTIMAKFTLEIELGNEAMQTPEDIAEALRKTASHVQAGYGNGTIRDLDGNSVGSYDIRTEPALSRQPFPVHGRQRERARGGHARARHQRGGADGNDLVRVRRDVQR